MSTHPPSSHDAARWRRIEDICDAALRLSESERDAYLVAACGSDQELRREVDGLLAHASTAERFLTTPLGAVSPAAEPPRDLIGRKIADYQIIAKLGEGGMGEVYRARDQKLGRDVAIKVLPPAFATDSDRMHRFEREARLLATVNHQYIGAIYGVIEIEGLPALVLELVSGETLSAVLARGPLKPQRALALAAQIADALDHAHRRGITHRDLKPSNIMVTPGGIKLLDFGVGKWTPAPTDGTMMRPSTLTNEGAIVGTLHYMSPEQLEGRSVDARSDIFAFGAVLFEMLSGRKAFDGPSQASIIAAVIEAPRPRLSGISGPHASRLDRIVSKCLARDPAERWQTARDLGDELKWLIEDVNKAAPLQAESPARRATTIAAGAAMVVAVALIGWAASWPWSSGVQPMPPISFTIHPQNGQLNDGGSFDISADGGQIAYSTSTNTATTLNLRRLDRFEAIALPTSGNVGSPVFSPDGQWIAFTDRGVLRKVSTKGDAAPVVLTPELSQGFQLGMTFEIRWRTSGAVYLVSRNQPIGQVTANGGRPEPVTAKRPDTDIDHHTPEALPSGRALLFGVHGKRNRFSIAAQDYASGERKTIIESGFSPVYSPTGHLLFGRGSSILAVPFDERSLEVGGEAVTLVEGVESDPKSGAAYYRVSKNGTLLFQPKRPRSARQLTWVDRAGNETPVSIPAQAFESARLSPDGTQLVFSAEDNDRRDIWTYGLNRGALTRLTQDGDNWSPIWTPDGAAVIHSRDGGNVAQVIRHPLDGAPIETLGSSEEDLWPTDVTRDNQHVIVTGQPPTDELFLAQLNRGSAAPQVLLQKLGFPLLGRLSPDGRWLAYHENVGSRREVFIQGYPEPGQRRQVSTDGGNQPVWRRDGKELFFRSGTRMFAVTIDTNRGLHLGRPTMLFDRRYLLAWNSYDVAADGRFLMIKPSPSDESPGQLNVVVNWRDELVKRVPLRR